MTETEDIDKIIDSISNLEINDYSHIVSSNYKPRIGVKNRIGGMVVSTMSVNYIKEKY